MPNRPLHPDASIVEKAVVMLLSWLIPGAGYGVKGDGRLFAVNFILIQSVFLIGLFVFHAGVAIPVLDRASQEFSLINVFMLFGELMNGLLAIVSMVGVQANPEFWGHHAGHWASDLGAFYLLIAGALNTFVLFGIWDRYYGRDIGEPATSKAEERK